MQMDEDGDQGCLEHLAGEVDDEAATLSFDAQPTSESLADKLKQYRVSTNDTSQSILCFNTRCEFFLFILIAMLFVAAAYLVTNNRHQQKEISSILDQLSQKNSRSDKQQSSSSNTLQSESQNQDLSSLAARSILQDSQFHRKVGTLEIAKKIWYFSQQDLSTAKNWTRLAFQRIRKASKQSGFELNVVNFANWRSFVPRWRQFNMTVFEKKLKEINSKQSASNSRGERLLRETIVLEILRQNGGIFIEEDVVLTEGLQWVASVGGSSLANAWQLIKAKGSPQLLGFFDPELSSTPEKHDRINVSEEPEKYIVRIPSLTFDFLAAAPYSVLIADLLDQYYVTIEGMKFGEEGQSKHDGIFGQVCKQVLNKKQSQLQEGELVLEYYRLAAINSNFGPTKMRSYLGEKQAEKFFNHISFLSRQELQNQFGTIRFFASVQPLDKLQKLLDRAIQNKQVLKGSFLHEYLLENEEGLSVPDEKVSQQRWDSLPGKLWLYLPQPPHSSHFFTQLWLKHLQKTARQSAFELIVLTDDNLSRYVSAERLNEITNILATTKLSIYQSAKLELVSLAVMYEHGGVWVNSHVVFPSGLGWLREIGRQRFIWNRFGQLPGAVLSFHPHYGSPFRWDYNAQTGAKEAWHLAYEQSFMAAEPNSQLFKDWLGQLLDNLKLDYDAILTKFDACKIRQHQWISKKSQGQLLQDSIKCVLGRKNAELASSGGQNTAAAYYRLWGLNGYSGLFKMREYTNFVARNNMENPYIWRYSLEEAESLMGKIAGLVILYDSAGRSVEDLLLQNLQAPQKEIHSSSLFTILLNSSSDKLVKSNGKLYFEGYLRDRQEALAKKLEADKPLQLLSNIPKFVWIYQNSDSNLNDKLTVQLLNNNKRYAQESGFQVRYVIAQTIKLWLSPQSDSYLKLSSFLSKLEDKKQKESNNLRDHYERIKSEAILLTLLYEFGGVFVNKMIVFHENLNWLHQVESLDFVNHGGNSPPQVFGYFSPSYSSSPISQDNHVETPSLENFFLASGKKTEFLKDLIQEYMIVVEQNTVVKERLQKTELKLNSLHGDDPYYECFYLACQFALHKAKPKIGTEKNPLDYYGLYSLNTRFFPLKLHKYFSGFKTPSSVILKALSGTHLSQLEQQIGNLRHFSVIADNQLIHNALKPFDYTGVIENSFIHLFLAPESSQVVKKQLNYVSEANSEWTSLPKIAWIYSAQSVFESPISVQLLFETFKTAAVAAGFEVKEINDNNIEHFIDKISSKKLNKITSGGNEQYRSLLYRLAILSRYGGVAFPRETLLSQNFTWITKIASLPPTMLFNREGQTPKVVMSVDTVRSPATYWEYDKAKGTKIGHNIGWDHAFLAAEKQNELIKSWQEELSIYLELGSKQIQQFFEDCNIRGFEWSAADPSKLGTDALLCVLHRKQTELADGERVCNYFGLWGVGQSFGINKMEEGVTLESEEGFNSFLWRRQRGQVESLIGPIAPFIQLSSSQVQKINELITNNKLANEGVQESLLNKIIYEPFKKRLKLKNDKLVLQ